MRWYNTCMCVTCVSVISMSMHLEAYEDASMLYALWMHAVEQLACMHGDVLPGAWPASLNACWKNKRKNAWRQSSSGYAHGRAGMCICEGGESVRVEACCMLCLSKGCLSFHDPLVGRKAYARALELLLLAITAPAQVGGWRGSVLCFEHVFHSMLYRIGLPKVQYQV